jgi:ATP-dependent 26S proteasome regulatory subunit
MLLLCQPPWTPPPWGGAPHCFVEGTKVLIPSGSRAIEELSEGDTVLSWDFAASRASTTRVKVKHCALSNETLKVSIGEADVECTPEHPFFVVGKAWVKASDIHEGDVLLTVDGGHVSVVAVVPSAHDVRVKVYDLTVSGDMPYYFVGPANVLVHNKHELE